MADTGSGTGIGARLRAGREKMGLTQLQTAEKLHVDPKVVDNLEAEAFEALGAPVFVRGHVRHYAELIGEQAAPLLEIYTAATQPAPPDLTKLPKAARRASSPSRLAVPALVVLIGFVLLGVVWWVVKSVGGSEDEKPNRGPQPVVIAPEVSRDPAVLDEPAGDAGAPNRVAAPAGAGAHTSAAGASTAATPAAVRGASGAPAASTAAASAATTTPARAGKAMEVTLRFAADSWVEVYDANGEKLFYDVGSADSSRTVSGTPPFRVHVANAPGVTLDVNGKRAAVPANALKGDEAQFTINRAGRIVRAVPQADGG
jgi:cytoskeleton protein RodZ